MEEEIRKIPRVLQHSGGCRRITPWPLERTTSASACLFPFDLLKQFESDIAELLRLARREPRVSQLSSGQCNGAIFCRVNMSVERTWYLLLV